MPANKVTLAAANTPARREGLTSSGAIPLSRQVVLRVAHGPLQSRLLPSSTGRSPCENASTGRLPC